MSDLIRLSCPSCGGKLELTRQIERFACAHCGTEHLLYQGGGVYALKTISEDLKEIRKGTDRTANELTIQRLQSELGRVDDRLYQTNSTYDELLGIYHTAEGKLGVVHNRLRMNQLFLGATGLFLFLSLASVFGDDTGGAGCFVTLLFFVSLYFVFQVMGFNAQKKTLQQDMSKVTLELNTLSDEIQSFHTSARQIEQELNRHLAQVQMPAY